MTKNTVFTTDDVGHMVLKVRKEQGLTQPQLAAVAGVGVRFIVDLEKGKPTCEVGKVLSVLHALGVHLVADV